MSQRGRPVLERGGSPFRPPHISLMIGYITYECICKSTNLKHKQYTIRNTQVLKEGEIEVYIQTNLLKYKERKKKMSWDNLSLGITSTHGTVAIRTSSNGARLLVHPSWSGFLLLYCSFLSPACLFGFDAQKSIMSSTNSSKNLIFLFHYDHG